MAREKSRFIRDTDAFTSARTIFLQQLEKAKKSKEDKHLDIDDILTRTLTELGASYTNKELKNTNNDQAITALHSYQDESKRLVVPNLYEEDYASLKQSLASLLYNDELETYRKQRTIRKTCYAALFISVSAPGAMGVAKTLGAERCVDAFDLKSADWSNAATLGLTAAVVVGFIAAIVLLKTKMNRLDRTELTELAIQGGATKLEINDKLSILDVYPLKVPQEILGWFKKRTETLEDPVSMLQRRMPNNGDSGSSLLTTNGQIIPSHFDLYGNNGEIPLPTPDGHTDNSDDDLIILVVNDGTNKNDPSPTLQNYNPGGS